MRAVGVTRIDQIATPTETERKQMQSFASPKAIATWSDEAKKLME
ncbi:hypothetical protein [Marinobacter sp. X15-166B]|nr:hypothetical protein [Marinobacter sp. X15-166B]